MLLNNYYTKKEYNDKIDESLNGYYTRIESDDKLSSTLTNYYNKQHITSMSSALSNEIDDIDTILNITDQDIA
jgi:hypothetical protein